jgi:hypothetical protein
MRHSNTLKQLIHCPDLYDKIFAQEMSLSFVIEKVRDAGDEFN